MLELGNRVPLLVKVLAGAAISASALIAACSGTEGVTPDCKYNVGGNGVYADPEGCEQFAVCAKAPKDPKQCCTDAKNKPLTGDALTVCLYGYGAAMISSSSSSSGDAGTGGTGTGGGGTGGGTGGTGTGGAGGGS